jgi:hypothetical protein
MGPGFVAGPLSLKISRKLAVSCRVGLPGDAITVLIGAVLAALTLGYLAGLLSFKVKDRWCPHCGATTSDLVRQHAGRVR